MSDLSRAAVPPERLAPADPAPPDPLPGPAVDTPAGPAHDERVIPLRHPWRWVLTALVLVLVAQLAHGLVTNPFFQWGRFRYWFLRPIILHGLGVTLQVTALSAVFGLVGGIVLALARMSRSPVLRVVSWTYVWLLRSVPLIVLLLFLANFSALYRTVSLGVPFGPHFVEFDEARAASSLVVAVVGISLNEAAYAAEVVRGGLLSVDQGQHEAAAALGLPRRYQFTRIIFPQALRAIVPAYVNQLIGLVKSTSLVFYVSLLDVFGRVETLGSTYPSDIVPLLLVATVWYVVLTSVVSVAQFYVERYFSRGALRTVPPTPWQRLRTAVADLRARARLATGAAR
ncbi:amino acid ABC transporter membrane protein, PAAT family [Actinacidiphila yanglinensis]|uniref:Amino acid ABC transporter membrane protein, PAAT family n=1 Tax=Actinacidiphila yanglinensis TaxID=310779 RepID=A0A1H6E8Q7_9ACTN|nr:amino acid ABC transporter permease [Actinacidiphila yanglinensis]SEG93316.1 amino acid ABC transporter membrane protein, PAAT family [Actinacidiphila yanglinensis]